MEFNYKPVRTDNNRKRITEKVNDFRLYGLEEKNGKFRIEVFHKQHEDSIFIGNYDTQKEFEIEFENQYEILSIAEHNKYFNKFKSKEIDEEIKITSNDGKVIVEVRCIQSEKGIHVPIIDDGVKGDLGRNFPDIDSARRVAQNTIRAYNRWGNYIRMSLTRKGRLKLPHEIYKEELSSDVDKDKIDFDKFMIKVRQLAKELLKEEGLI